MLGVMWGITEIGVVIEGSRCGICVLLRHLSLPLV